MTTRPDTRPKLALGIAIDEEVSIGFAARVANEDKLSFYNQILTAKIDRGDVAASLEHAIRELTHQKPYDELLASVEAVGVSTIGLVNSTEFEIHDIARPGWKLGSKGPLSLPQLVRRSISELPEVATSSARFKVLNDATAYAAGERRYGVLEHFPVQSRRSKIGEAVAFIRVGEGVNAGVVISTHAWRGGLHPELGHIIPPRAASETQFDIPSYSGACRFHGACLEGQISKAALLERWGAPDLPSLWRDYPESVLFLADHIAYLCSVITMTIAPAAIVLGGSMANDVLASEVRKSYGELVAGYPTYPDNEDLDEFILVAKGGRNANMFGILSETIGSLRAVSV